MSVIGLIPAAGESSRTKGFKLFYDWDGVSILQAVIKNMSLFCEKIIVITGYMHEQIINHLKGYDAVKIVNNPDWKSGMITSIRCGLSYAGGQDILYCPADYPGISKETFKTVLYYGKSEKCLCMAEFQGRTGPPLFMPAKEVTFFLKNNWQKSLREWIGKRNHFSIECSDSWVLEDIDTDTEYDLLKM